LVKAKRRIETESNQAIGTSDGGVVDDPQELFMRRQAAVLQPTFPHRPTRDIPLSA
jgi:hypothetical protein